MRQSSVVVLLLTSLFASLALSQSTASNKKKKTTAAKSTAKKGKASSKTAKRAAVVTPYRQAAPAPERYKEIQQALADKGYLKSEPNGVWDADSTAALAKFQSDRSLMPTGKITSASLIALGLGPSTAPIPGNPNVHPAADGTTGAPPPPSPSPSLSN
jgi:hypothetical protein